MSGLGTFRWEAILLTNPGEGAARHDELEVLGDRSEADALVDLNLGLWKFCRSIAHSAKARNPGHPTRSCMRISHHLYSLNFIRLLVTPLARAKLHIASDTGPLPPWG